MRSALLAAGLLAGLAACTPVGTPPAAPVEQHFEAIAVPGSYKVSDDLIKLNTGTGDAWIHCCGTNNNTFVHVKDDKAPPAGDYHLIHWAQTAPNGDVSFNVYRFDSRTGHAWVFQSQENGGVWIDIASTLTEQ